MTTKAHFAALLLIGLLSVSIYAHSQELEEPWLQTSKEKPQTYSEGIGVNTERWLLAGKDKLQRRLYVDSETIKKDIISTQDMNSFSLVYSFWLKTAAFNGATTPPQKVTIDCLSRSYDADEIIPESKEEVLYKYFCQSVEAKNTIFPKTHDEQVKDIVEQEKKAEEFRQKQLDERVKAFEARAAEEQKQRQAWFDEQGALLKKQFEQQAQIVNPFNSPLQTNYR